MGLKLAGGGGGGGGMGEEREKTLSYQILIIHFLKGIRRELVICCLTQLRSSCISHLGWVFLPSVGLLSLGIGYRDWDTTRSNGGWSDTGTCIDKNMFKNVANIPLSYGKKILNVLWTSKTSIFKKHFYAKVKGTFHSIILQRKLEHYITYNPNSGNIGTFF